MEMRRPRRRLATIAVPVCLLVAGLALAAPSPAGAATDDERRVLQLANQVRASAGARPLVLDEALSVTARRWAATVAAAGRISHNPDLPLTTSGPTAIAENVVVGPDIQTAHDALVASRTHYVNLVNPTVTQVGIGVAWAGGRIYVVQNFLIVRGATVPTSPPAPTPRTTAPPGTAPRDTAPPVTARPGAAPSTTIAPPVPTSGAPAPLQAPASGPSDRLALSLEVLRGWDRAAW